MLNTEINDVPGEMRLRDLKNGLYQIHSKHGAFEGRLNLIYWKAVKWGINPVDLAFAVKLMKTENHDYANFGVFGGLLYSAKDDETKAS